MMKLALLILAAFVVGYAMGRARGRSERPVEIYTRDGKRVQ